jgi:hypothetical protein
LERWVGKASESGDATLWPKIEAACAEHPSWRWTVLWHLPFYWREHPELVAEMALNGLGDPRLRSVALHAASGFPTLLERLLVLLQATRDPEGYLAEEIIACLASMLGEVGRPLDYEGMPADSRKQVAGRVDERLRAEYGLTLDQVTGPQSYED